MCIESDVVVTDFSVRQHPGLAEQPLRLVQLLGGHRFPAVGVQALDDLAVVGFGERAPGEHIERSDAARRVTTPAWTIVGGTPVCYWLTLLRRARS